MSNRINSETVIAFLKLKGWEEVKQDSKYVHLCSPKQHSSKESSLLYIPLQKLKDTPFYNLSINSVIHTIGRIYDIKQKDLVKYFTKSIDEIGKEMSFHKAILAHAS